MIKTIGSSQLVPVYDVNERFDLPILGARRTVACVSNSDQYTLLFMQAKVSDNSIRLLLSKSEQTVQKF